MDRRSGERCPLCQGPAVADEYMPGGMRCRQSVCRQNHSGVKCPRCSSANLESVSYKDKAYNYTCEDCTNKWKLPAGD